jgi:serine/threonine-protein kinase HipA
MTSKPLSEAYVWVFLPGDVQPTLCGRFRHEETAAGQPVGSFVYGRSFLGHDGRIALDPVDLPLAERVFEIAGGGGIFGVFADACPDDWGRYVIDRQHGAQPYPLGYLLKSQEDRVGNLCFSASAEEPPNLAPPTSVDLLNDAWRVVADLEQGRPVPPELAAKVRPNTALGGARPKLTVADGSVQWLAKFPTFKDNPRRPVPKLEAAVLKLAESCGIASVETKLVPIDRLGDQDVALLVRRFDRSQRPEDAGSGQWQRDGYVSARTILQSSNAQSLSFTGSYSALARGLQRWSSHAQADRYSLFRRMVFNCCVSNTDDHERNHGFLADEEKPGSYRLSPAFDIVPRLHGTTRRYQALNIGDAGAEPSVANLVSSCDAFKISEGDARRIIDDVETAVQENWRRVLLEHDIERTAVDELARCFEPLPEGDGEPDQAFEFQAPRM